MPSNSPLADSVARLVDSLVWLIPLGLCAVIVLLVLLTLVSGRSPRRY
jgi:hypothetical protein